jgi:uncharacterized protein (TIGR00725 family)
LAVQLGIIGAGVADGELQALAREVGELAAFRGWIVVCGGLGGVMEAASAGAESKGGLVIGLLPGDRKSAANSHVVASIPTGLGHARNAVIALAADVLIAIGGGYGTLSEMALGLKMGKSVVSLRSWTPDTTVISAGTAAEAVAAAEKALETEREEN